MRPQKPEDFDEEDHINYDTQTATDSDSDLGCHTDNDSSDGGDGVAGFFSGFGAAGNTDSAKANTAPKKRAEKGNANSTENNSTTAAAKKIGVPGARAQRGDQNRRGNRSRELMGENTSNSAKSGGVDNKKINAANTKSGAKGESAGNLTANQYLETAGSGANVLQNTLEGILWSKPEEN